MEKTNLHYSTKNIPIASERNYKIQLLDKIEAVIKRMRWKAIFFDEESDIDNEHSEETYGLKTKNTPPPVKEMNAFENDLIDMINILKFRKGRTEFQSKLSNDIKSINDCDKIYAQADKTSNMYKLSKGEYDKIITNSITSTYKKATSNAKENINKQGKAILHDSDIMKRMEINSDNNCFFTLKDHKENFNNNPTTRLINPAKNELGRISKTILQHINKTLRTNLKLNQWNNTANVIKWFENIEEKHLHKFMVFDIKDFYPSIKEQLLINALQFANSLIPINSNEREIIHHARKSLLFNNEEIWMKRNGKLFDVTMGAFDGAEVCELVGCFILSQITEKFEKNNIGLYRDDGLAVFKNISGPQSEKIKKQFQKFFKDNGLDIVIQCNMKIVDYLDVTLNLNDSTYKPYHKPDNELNYVHKDSNHPPNIIKQIPIAIETRLSNLSSNETIFNQATPYYEEALKRSGYHHIFKYNPQLNLNIENNQNRTNKNRKRNILWFNPPFNKNVSTQIGKYFLNLIKEHFPQHHKLHKIFNKNTVKMSYSCMPNIKSTINAHNKKLISPTLTQQNIKTCNCRNKELCPMNNNCLASNIIYQATISSNLESYNEKIYIGLCETTFKKRYANHKQSFNTHKYKNSTSLSNEFWRIKELNGQPVIKWKVLRRSSSYNPNSKKCKLCLNEKYEIATFKGMNILNKRSEIISKCRHQNKYSLASHDTKD